MAGRTRTNVPAVIYYDFQPKSERKEEPAANVLVVHLPGFGKDQISVTYVDSSSTIKVEGERPLEENRRSRFNQTFPVPQNSVTEKIQGSFRNGILTLTIPKQTVDQVSSAKDADASKETTPPKAISQQKSIKDPKETTTPPKAASPSHSGISQTPQKAIPEPPKPKSPQKTSPKPATGSTSADAGQSNGKKDETLQPPKAEKKVAPTATTPKQTDEKTSGSKAKVVEKKGEPVEEKETSKDVKDSTLSEPKIPKTLEKEKADDHKADLVSELNIPKTLEMEKKDDRKAGGVVEDTKAVKGGSLFAKAKEMKGMETIMKTMKRLTTDDEEDRQMLISVGVSVLVIVALGAYLTYTYRSSGKAKH